MALADQPVLSTTTNPLDEVDFNPDIPADLENPEVGQHRLAEAAAIRTMEDDESNFINEYLDLETLTSSQDLNSTEARQLAVVAAIENSLRANTEVAEGMIIHRPDLAESAIQALSDVNAEVRAEGQRQDAPYQVITKQFQDPTLVTEEERKGLAVRAALADQVHEMVADSGLWGLIGDIGLELIPFKFMVDLIQTTGTINPFEWEERVRGLVSQYQEMSPEEQLDRVPVLQESLLEFLPPFRVATIITAIIDPSQEEFLAFEFGTLGIADAVLTAAAFLSIASRLKVLTNLPKLASKSGDLESAAKINATVLIDQTDTASTVTQVSKNTAINNSTPFNVEKLDPAADPSMSGAVANNIVAYRELLKGKLADLEEGKAFIPEGMLAESDIPKAVARIDDIFDAHVAGMAREDKIVDITRVDKTIGPRGVTYDFIYKDNKAVTEDIGTFSRQFVMDDNGIWKSLPEPTIASRIMLSPKAMAAGGFERIPLGAEATTDFLESVNSAIRLDFPNALVRKEFSDLMFAAVKPITGLGVPKARTRKINEVGEILTYGDEAGKNGRVFTPAELRAGVVGHQLADDQMEVYYNVRALLDGIADLRDAAAKRPMVERGVRTIFMEGEAAGFGVPFQTAAEATTAIADKSVLTIWDVAAKQAIEVKLLDMEGLYAAGKRLVRMEESLLLNNKLHRHVLTRVQGIKQLPQQVLHRKIGYIPRVNPRAAHFVQVLSETTIDGIRTQSRKAIRSFDTAKQAAKFRDEFEASVRAGDTDFRTKAKVVVNKDKEIEQFNMDRTGIGSTQGLIYGPRRSEALPHGPIGTEQATPRVGAFESIGLYLENTKNFVTRNDWRMSQRRIWENSARKQTGNEDITFTSPGKAFENKALKDAHDQIQEWSGFLAPSERLFDEMVQRLYEVTVNLRPTTFVGKKVQTKVAERIHSMKHKDGAAMIKTVAFHSTLGGLNPAQLIVQGSGSAVALSTNIWRPDKLAKILWRQNGLAAAQMMDEVAHPKAYAKVARAFGWKPKELSQYQDLWKRTGFFDSVLNSADIEAAQAGFGMTAASWRKAQEISTYPFRKGELFNRRISFLTAVDELGGINRVSGNLALEKQMITRVSDLLLNLGPANRAWWQKGVWGIPTQFMQIMTKTAETYLGLNGAFTPAQRMKLFISQYALYGAAAVPFAAYFNRMYLDQTGWTKADINDPANKGKIAFMNGGASDYLMQVYLGADVTIADRLSLANGWDSAIVDLFEESTPLAMKATGPAGGVAKRVWDKIAVMSPFFGRYPLPDEFKDITRQDVLDTIGFMTSDAGELLASPFSTTSQMNRTIQMRNWDAIFDKRGGKIAEAGPNGYNVATLIASAMGAKPLQMQEKFTLQEINRNQEDYLDHGTNQLMYNFQRYMREVASASRAGRPVDQSIIDRYDMMRDVIEMGIGNHNDRKKVSARFADRVRALRLGQTQLDRQTDQFFKNYKNELSDETSSANTKLTPLR